MTACRELSVPLHVLLACALMLWCRHAQGEAPCAIRGLQFETGACAELGERHCRFTLGGRERVMRCPEALRALLKSAHAHGHVLPTTEQLSAFLRSAESRPVYVEALTLLLSRSAALSAGEIEAHLGRYETAAARKLLCTLSQTPTIARQLWRTFIAAEGHEAAAAVVAGCSSFLSVEEVFAALAMRDGGVAALEALRDAAPGGSALRQNAESFLLGQAQCSAHESTVACADFLRSRAGPVAKRYLTLLRHEALLRWVDEAKPAPEVLLESLYAGGFHHARTPELHRLVRESLARSGEKQLSHRAQVLLAPWAQHDPEVRSLRSERRSNTLRLLALFMVCVCLGLLTYERGVQRRSRPAWEMQEDAELRSLRAYFSLRRGATQRELHRAYRRRARALHPDLNKSAAGEFVVLQQNYQRLRELLPRASDWRRQIRG